MNRPNGAALGRCFSVSLLVTPMLAYSFAPGRRLGDRIGLMALLERRELRGHRSFREFQN